MLYAAYGSNLHPVRLLARIRSAKLLGTSQLAGWDLRFHKRGTDGSGKGNIVEASGGVYVAVYDMTKEGMSMLDGIEGVGTGYARSLIEVPDFGECFTYIARATHIDDALQPYDWYREMILLGCRKHAFPDDYVTRISRIRPIADRNPQRREENWAMVERLREHR